MIWCSGNGNTVWVLPVYSFSIGLLLFCAEAVSYCKTTDNLKDLIKNPFIMILLKFSRPLVLLLFLFGIGAVSNAQTVLAAGGNTSEGQNISLSWTLGELAISTLTTEKGFLTEGFHQPEMLVERLDAATEKWQPGIKVSIAPNPVQQQLYVELFHTEDLDFTLSMYDLNGKRLWLKQGKDVQRITSIDMMDLPSGFYILKIENLTTSVKLDFSHLYAIKNCITISNPRRF